MNTSMKVGRKETACLAAGHFECYVVYRRPNWKVMLEPSFRPMRKA